MEEVKTEAPAAKRTLTIAEGTDDRRAIAAVDGGGEPLTLQEIREMLQWALNRVSDEIAVSMARATLNEALRAKFQTKGFRPETIKDFLVK